MLEGEGSLLERSSRFSPLACDTNSGAGCLGVGAFGIGGGGWEGISRYSGLPIHLYVRKKFHLYNY